MLGYKENPENSTVKQNKKKWRAIHEAHREHVRTGGKDAGQRQRERVKCKPD